MKNYEKPIAIINDDKSEGIYAASGCYEIKTTMHQPPQTGRGDYRIQIDGKHNADHSNETQYLDVVFNMPVVYKSSSGTLVYNTGNTLTIKYDYHQNPTDNIGLGDLVVSADAGLRIININLRD